MTLSDRERWDARGHKFLADLRYYAGMASPGMTKFGVATQEGRSMFLRGQSKGVGLSIPKFLGTLYVRVSR